jgi:hypothetical protein
MVRYSVQSGGARFIRGPRVKSRILKPQIQPTPTRPNPLDIITHFHSSKHTS